jgi:hypothetical protein
MAEQSGLAEKKWRITLNVARNSSKYSNVPKATCIRDNWVYSIHGFLALRRVLKRVQAVTRLTDLNDEYCSVVSCRYTQNFFGIF